MEITIAELLQGKATIIKNKDYLSTREYVEPFFEKMAPFTDTFKISVRLPDQMTITTTQDVTFNRVLIEAVLPTVVDNHQEVIGFLYGLDVRKPIVKIYRGHINGACTNLCVFSPRWQTVQELKPNERPQIEVKDLLELPNNFPQKLLRLKDTFIDDTQLFHKLGGWVDSCLRDSWYNSIQNVKISPSLPIEAYKSLFIDEKSSYFVKPNTQASMFDVYNAFTQVITDDKKDIINRFEKTMMVNKLLEV